MSENSLAELPLPSPSEAAHSRALQDLMIGEMERGAGWIDFERYMDLALFAPGLGYYVAGARKLGQQGDFVTAPEISALFSRCVARQVGQILERFRHRGVVLEFGAGSGEMAASILAELEARGELPAEYWILEVSPDLRERQQDNLKARLPHLMERIHWLERLPTSRFQGVVLANEVLDAMPVRRFRMTAGGPRPLQVSHGGGTLNWRLGEKDGALCEALDGLQASLGRALEEGYESEYNPHLRPWIRSVSDCLAEGLVMVIDYGYPRDEFYHPQRRSGTLVCHYRHRAHFDPLWYPGLQDISASVDFSAVAEAAQDAGLDVAGFTNQAWFLLSSGLDEFLAAEDPNDAARFLEVTRQAKILTLPGEMGERFKAMALTRGLEGGLIGFAQQDWRHKL